MVDNKEVDRVVRLGIRCFVITVIISILGAFGARYILFDEEPRVKHGPVMQSTTPVLAAVDDDVRYCGCLRCDQIPAPP